MLHPFSSMSELYTFRQLLPSTWVEENGYIRLPPPHPSRVYKSSDSPLLPLEHSKDVTDPAFLEPTSAGPSPPLSSTRSGSPYYLDLKKSSNTTKFLQFRSSPISHAPHSLHSPSSGSSSVTLYQPHSPSPLPYPLRSSEGSYRPLESLRSHPPMPKESSSPLYMKKGMLSMQGRSSSSDLHNLSGVKKKRANFSKKTKDLLLLWLEEHLENPYPSEKDKQELARATSLSLNQVNNWFVNARRRHLWLNANTKRHMLARRASRG